MDQKMDLRIQKTYLALHQAFSSLLEEKHFEDFTVNELCDRAMIRRTTFYKHFADKYDYFAFYAKEVCTSFREQFDPAANSEDVKSYFLHMSRQLHHFLKTHSKMANNVIKSNMLLLLLDILSDYITADTYAILSSSKERKEKSSKELEGLAAYFAGGIINTLLHFYKQEEQLEEEEFIKIVSSSFGNW